MSLSGKILRGICLFLLFFFTATFTVSLVIWTWPSILFNPKNAQRAARYLERQGVSLTWSYLDLSAHSNSFFSKRIGLYADNFCLKIPSSGIDVCFKTIALPLVVQARPSSRHVHLGAVRLDQGEIRLTESPSTPGQETFESGALFSPPTLPSLLKYFSFESLDVKNVRLDYAARNLKVEALASVTARGAQKRSQWNASVKGTLLSKKDLYQVDGSVGIRSLKDVWFGPYETEGAIRAKLPKSGKGAFTWRGQSPGLFSASGNFSQAGKSLNAKLNGSASQKQLNVGIDASVKLADRRLKSIAIKHCQLSMEKQEATRSNLFQVDCPAIIQSRFTVVGLPTPLQRFAAVRISGKVDLKEEKRRGPTLDGNLLVAVRTPVKAPENTFQVRVPHFNGPLSDLSLWKIGASIDIPHFQRLVELLEKTPWAVPGPFNNLTGHASIDIPESAKLGTFALSLKTRLVSPHQKVSLDGNGELAFRHPKGQKKTLLSHLKLKLNLTDVHLVLPYLQLTSPPQVIPDPRIVKPETLEKQLATPEPTFSYEIEIANPPSHPVQFTSNLAKSPVPVSLALQTSSTHPLHGYVRVLEFPIELFRREGKVDHMYLKITEDPDKSEVNGEIRVNYANATIRILLLGPLEKPQIKFLSEPPLPEDKVIALLLFGKEPEFLDNDQATSVGSTRAALGDSAVSLASMYVLASTPVERIGYDPISRVFKARIRLADGTSLNVGTDLKDLTQLGIRKRLGANWSISTYLSRPLDFQRSLTAFLEWSKGY